MRKFSAETIGSITGAGSVIAAGGVYGFGAVLVARGGTVPFSDVRIHGSLGDAALWLVVAALPLLIGAALLGLLASAALSPIIAETRVPPTPIATLRSRAGAVAQPAVARSEALDALVVPA